MYVEVRIRARFIVLPVGTEEDYGKLRSGWAVSGPRFKPSTSGIATLKHYSCNNLLGKDLIKTNLISIT
jgi:hypothetical protein